MRLLVGYALLGVLLSLLAYFVYGLIWFAFLGHRNEGRRTVAATSFGYMATLSSAALWFAASFWSRFHFVNDPGGAKERTLIGLGVGLCVAALVAARFSTRRMSIPIVAGALVVALNWIGSVLRD